MPNKAKPIVWVVQEGKNDYAAAEQFGEVNFVTKSDLRSMKGEQQRQVHADIRQFLTNYIPGHDYIVPAGNPIILALLCMALGVGSHKFLKWDGMRATYVLFDLDYKELGL